MLNKTMIRESHPSLVMRWLNPLKRSVKIVSEGVLNDRQGKWQIQDFIIGRQESAKPFYDHTLTKRFSLLIRNHIFLTELVSKKH